MRVITVRYFKKSAIIKRSQWIDEHKGYKRTDNAEDDCFNAHKFYNSFDKSNDRTEKETMSGTDPSSNNGTILMARLLQNSFIARSI